MDSLQDEPSPSLERELLEVLSLRGQTQGALSGGAAPAPWLQLLPVGSQKLVPLLSQSLTDTVGRHVG